MAASQTRPYLRIKNRDSETALPRAEKPCARTAARDTNALSCARLLSPLLFAGTTRDRSEIGYSACAELRRAAVVAKSREVRMPFLPLRMGFSRYPFVCFYGQRGNYGLRGVIIFGG